MNAALAAAAGSGHTGSPDIPMNHQTFWSHVHKKYITRVLVSIYFVSSHGTEGMSAEKQLPIIFPPAGVTHGEWGRGNGARRGAGRDNNNNGGETPIDDDPYPFPPLPGHVPKGELLSPCPFACLFPSGQVVCCDDDVGGSLSFLSSDRFSKYINLFSKNINRVYVRTYATYM